MGFSEIDPKIITSIISILSAIIIVSLTYIFTKSKEREAEWRKEKLNFYIEFIKSISEITKENITKNSSDRFAKACNNFYLFAPENILKAMQDYREETNVKNKTFNSKKAEEKLKELISLIRKDINIKKANIDNLDIKIYLGLPNSSFKK